MTLIDLLRSPSAFEGRPYSFARNQIGHGYLVGGIGAYLIGPGILIVYLAWEAVQYRRYAGALWDGVEDFANVLTVALAVMLHQPMFLAVHAAYLLAGFLRRRA